MRALPMGTFNIQRFMQAFPLSEPEGRSLMALAEAFLRIPDSYTAGLLLEDKLSQFDLRKGGLRKMLCSRFLDGGFKPSVLCKAQFGAGGPACQFSSFSRVYALFGAGIYCRAHH